MRQNPYRNTPKIELRGERGMENLTPGFRFYPTDDELVSFHLSNKLDGKNEDLNRIINRVIPDLDIYDFNPWELPQFAGELCKKDPEQWFFFIPRQESEARGGRPKRLTLSGYWKATGSPSYVYSSNNRVIGVKRTMVFYTGRAPTGRKTEWKMNEYKAIDQGEASSSSSSTTTSSRTHRTLRQEFSLCRVYKKSKCLRAFDRRPRPHDREIIGQPVTQEVQVDSGPPTVAERMCSPESSSSGDHGHHSQLEGETSSGNMMVDDNYPLWDWEQLNWF